MSVFDKLMNMNSDKASENLKAGEDFLEKNKYKEIVITTPSGLY